MDAEAKRLASLKEELLKDMAALERVERLMAAKNGSLNRPEERQFVLPISGKQPRVLDIDSAEEDAENAPTTSLRGKIGELINADPNVRWTTQRVLTKLQEMGFPLKAQKPIYSIGQSLQSLAKRGSIRVVHKGSGSAPNIYRGIQASAETEGPSEDTGGTTKTDVDISV
jgi:hypothetical protein